jgi:hypothetical protein
MKRLGYALSSCSVGASPLLLCSATCRHSTAPPIGCRSAVPCSRSPTHDLDGSLQSACWAAVCKSQAVRSKSCNWSCLPRGDSSTASHMWRDLSSGENPRIRRRLSTQVRKQEARTSQQSGEMIEKSNPAVSCCRPSQVCVLACDVTISRTVLIRRPYTKLHSRISNLELRI